MTAPVTQWWGRATATAAPILLVGGWTLAASRQVGFDSVATSISALAARGVDDRWIMTTALVAVGLCHLGTALALRPLATPPRVVLAVGGVATLGVAAFPLPAQGRAVPAGSATHALMAAVAFLALAAWPLLAGLPLHPAEGFGTTLSAWRVYRSSLAGVGLLLLVGWFGVELLVDGGRLGLAERVAAGAQAIWPAFVAWTTRVRGPEGASSSLNDRHQRDRHQ